MLLAVLLSLVMGVVLGLLGGGGSILTVPLLVYVLGVEQKAAIATSLLVVGVTSAVAATSHALAGRVRLWTALPFGVSSMAGAFAGGQLAGFLPGALLLTLFSALMLVTGAFLWRGRSEPCAPVSPAPRWRLPLQGLALGAVTGLVGAGGGFLFVPALVLLVGLPMREAAATSLVIIALNAAAGFVGHVGHVNLDVTLALVVGGCAVLGSLGGVALSARVPQQTLRRAFAVFVLSVGGLMLASELPAALG